MNRKNVILTGFILLTFVLASFLCYRRFTRGLIDDYSPEKVEQLRAWALQLIEQHGAEVSATNDPVRIGGGSSDRVRVKSSVLGLVFGDLSRDHQ